MNERIREFYHQSMFDGYLGKDLSIEKFAELIIRACNQAVLEVPCYYTDYRSQIESAVIHDCAQAVLECFGIKNE